jgi:hypothetical protein
VRRSASRLATSDARARSPRAIHMSIWLPSIMRRAATSPVRWLSAIATS